MYWDTATVGGRACACLHCLDRRSNPSSGNTAGSAIQQEHILTLNFLCSFVPSQGALRGEWSKGLLVGTGVYEQPAYRFEVSPGSIAAGEGLYELLEWLL